MFLYSSAAFTCGLNGNPLTIYGHLYGTVVYVYRYVDTTYIGTDLAYVNAVSTHNFLISDTQLVPQFITKFITMLLRRSGIYFVA